MKIIMPPPADVGTPQERTKLKEVAQNFEALFTDLVLKSMRSTVDKSGFMDGGNAEQIYSSMLDSEYSKIMSGTGKTGLADAIEAQLLRTMSASKKQLIQNHTESVNGKKAYQSASVVNND